MSCFPALDRERDAGISLAARCHTLLSRRPTRQSSLLHVYTMVFAYVSSFLGFPCETVTGGGGVTASDLVCGVFQTGFTVFSREFTNCFSLIVSFSSASIIWRGVFQTGVTVSQGSSRIVFLNCV